MDLEYLSRYEWHFAVLDFLGESTTTYPEYVCMYVCIYMLAQNVRCIIGKKESKYSVQRIASLLFPLMPYSWYRFQEPQTGHSNITSANNCFLLPFTHFSLRCSVRCVPELDLKLHTKSQAPKSAMRIFTSRLSYEVNLARWGMDIRSIRAGVVENRA